MADGFPVFEDGGDVVAVLAFQSVDFRQTVFDFLQARRVELDRFLIIPQLLGQLLRFQVGGLSALGLGFQGGVDFRQALQFAVHPPQQL